MAKRFFCSSPESERSEGFETYVGSSTNSIFGIVLSYDTGGYASPTYQGSDGPPNRMEDLAESGEEYMGCDQGQPMRTNPNVRWQFFDELLPTGNIPQP